MASGDTLVAWRALDAELPIDEFALFDTIQVNQVGLHDPLMPILVFEDGVNRYAHFGAVMPKHYTGNGINVELVWSSIQTTGNCVWIVSFKRIQDGVTDLDTAIFGNETFITPTTNAGANVVDYDTIAVSDGANMNNIAAGEFFKMELIRDGDSGSDTLAGDANLSAIIITEQ
jgi:hypothetical protein